MAYKIPLFDLNFDAAEENAVVETLRGRWISMGANVKQAEEQFSRHLKVDHAVAVTNCTAALHLSMKLLDIGPGDEVIVPSLTFVATTNAVLYAGATPVFVDITGPEDFSISPDDIARKITDKTKAVVVMHYGGFACDMDTIMALAGKHDLYVIEDAAHAPNSDYGDRKLGSIGHIGCFSFYSNKNITSGEGGMLTTNDEALAARARLLRSHGMTTVAYDRAKGHATTYDVVDLGYNYRMDDVRGALLVAQLKKLDDDTQRRRQVRDQYVKALQGQDGLYLPYQARQESTSNYIFPAVIKEGGFTRRDAIREYLKEAGIETSMHYPPVHRFSIYQQFTSDLPQTEFVADHEFTLPLYPGLANENVDYIVATLASALQEIS